MSAEIEELWAVIAQGDVAACLMDADDYAAFAAGAAPCVCCGVWHGLHA